MNIEIKLEDDNCCNGCILLESEDVAICRYFNSAIKILNGNLVRLIKCKEINGFDRKNIKKNLSFHWFKELKNKGIVK